MSNTTQGKFLEIKDAGAGLGIMKMPRDNIIISTSGRYVGYVVTKFDRRMQGKGGIEIEESQQPFE